MRGSSMKPLGELQLRGGWGGIILEGFSEEVTLR